MTRIIIDIPGTTCHVCEYLFTAILPANYVIDRSIITHLLNNLLVELIQVEIQNAKDPLAPDYCIASVCTALSNFNAQAGLNDAFTASMLMDMVAIILLLDTVRDLIKDNGFNMWVISHVQGLYILENLGDIRILTWEDDYIVDGKFRHKE